LAATAVLLAWRAGSEPSPPQQRLPVLSASPSDKLLQTLSPDVIPFEQALVEAIQQRGRLTVTVHVALADHRFSDVPQRFGDGDNPDENFYWGALFGVDTHLANAGGWRRAHTDRGDGEGVIRRVVFHRRAEPTPAWQARGVQRAFDVYLLTVAWPGSLVETAMEQPLREALSDQPVALTVEGIDLEFGAGGVMTGYLGPNWMIDHYWDPFSGLQPRPSRHQMGVFYISSLSAVHLHQAVVDRGLYSVLFARRPLIAEAYILEGLLEALLTGDLDDGFCQAAAQKYVRHQKEVSPEAARFLFFR
jgi:hypothetical protein